MPKNGGKPNEPANASDPLVRQMRRIENVRFLRRMPGFEALTNLPPQMHNLLHKLEQAERQQSPARRG